MKIVEWALFIVIISIPLKNEAPRPAMAFLPPNALQGLRTGDIIAREGVGWESVAVSSSNQSTRISHVGMVIKTGDRIMVLHAVPPEFQWNQQEKVHLDSLGEFVSSNQAKDVRFFRHAGMTRNLAANFNIEKYQWKIFDSAYDLSTTDKVYCTELVIQIYSDLGLSLDFQTRTIAILGYSRSIVFPEDLIMSPQLKELDFKFMEFHTTDSGSFRH